MFTSFDNGLQRTKHHNSHPKKPSSPLDEVKSTKVSTREPPKDVDRAIAAFSTPIANAARMK